MIADEELDSASVSFPVPLNSISTAPSPLLASEQKKARRAKLGFGRVKAVSEPRTRRNGEGRRHDEEE